ncbi:MAG: serine protease [Patescibacteria group bacterium]
MSEFVSHPVVKKVLATALAVVAFAGSGCGPEYAATAVIPRCYDTPLQPEYRPHHETKKLKKPRFSYALANELGFNEAYRRFDMAADAWIEQEHPYYQPELSIPVEDGHAVGDPIYSANINEIVSKSLVKISTDDWKGSGFLASNNKGEQVVVTAAHVVEKAKLKSLTIQTNQGESLHPDGGCYIYENKGKFKHLSNEYKTPVDTDIAILSLPGRFNNPNLRNSDQPPRRGNWVFFVNYQAQHEPGNPAIYTGVISATPDRPQGFSIITGAQKLRQPVSDWDISDSQVQSGASGGPVVDARGQVVGISIRGNKEGRFDDPSLLRDYYGVTFPGAKFGRSGGFIPSTAGIVSTKVINKALASPRN